MDDDAAAFAPPPQSHHRSLPSRRNSISTSITKLTLIRRRSATFPPDDLELLSINKLHSSCSTTTYTSLKDLLPSVAVNSPRPSPAQSGSDICIRNRLVKQAAWAYLQPMSTSTSTCSAGGNIFHSLLPRLTAFVASVVRILNRMLRVIRIRPTT